MKFATEIHGVRCTKSAMIFYICKAIFSPFLWLWVPFLIVDEFVDLNPNDFGHLLLCHNEVHLCGFEQNVSTTTFTDIHVPTIWHHHQVKILVVNLVIITC